MSTATVAVSPLRSGGSILAPVHVEPLGVEDQAAWDAFVWEQGGTVFHSTGWMRAVWEAFGHQPIYLTAWRGDRLAAVLPLFEVRSLLGGTMLVSVPYAVYGGALGLDREATAMLFDEAVGLARRVGARCVEVRSEEARWNGAEAVDRYVTFRGELPGDPNECLGRLPRKARAAARAARERFGLTVTFRDEHLPAVWRLYCRTMRRIGSINYPYRFFEAVVGRAPKCHYVSLVRSGDRAVGGLVTFVYGRTAMPYLVGTDERFARMNVSNFVYLTAMEEAVRRGCDTFDFGRSRRDNTGSCAFKRNQGFEPRLLGYQRWSPAGRLARDLTPGNPWFSPVRRVWPRLPTFVTRPAGAWLARHIPG